MDILGKFLSENLPSESAQGTAASARVAEAPPAAPEESKSGKLVITGCLDWQTKLSSLETSTLVLDEPHEVSLPYRVKQVFTSSSSLHTFLISEHDELYCFGLNDCGQLGLGDTATRRHPTLVPLPAEVTAASTSSVGKKRKGSDEEGGGEYPAGVRVLKVATGHQHTLVLFSNGQVYACGSNASGQLGLGASSVLAGNVTKLTKIAGGGLKGDTAVRDIAAGWEHSLACTEEKGDLLTWGHPRYGALGHGTDGTYIQKAGSISFDCVREPKVVQVLCCKDLKGKVIRSYRPFSSREDSGGGAFSSDSASVHSLSGECTACIKVRAVAAGKHHSFCIEEWDGADGEEASSAQAVHCNRVFAWGFGGYGRLGHGSADDENRPRELIYFSNPAVFNPSLGGTGATAVRQPCPHLPIPQRRARSIVCGAASSALISASHQVYVWGSMGSASVRGEAITTPRPKDELLDWTDVDEVQGSGVGMGPAVVVVARKGDGSGNGAGGRSSSSAGGGGPGGQCVGWGAPVAGRLGLDEGSRVSKVPKYITTLCSYPNTAAAVAATAPPAPGSVKVFGFAAKKAKEAAAAGPVEVKERTVVSGSVQVLQVSCGYSHVCFVVNHGGNEGSAGVGGGGVCHIELPTVPEALMAESKAPGKTAGSGGKKSKTGK